MNGTEIATYYHGGYGSTPPFEYLSQFPTVDLAKFACYNDQPGEQNTVELENLGTATLSINNDPNLGGVDIYRFYKVNNICQDSFGAIDQNGQDKILLWPLDQQNLIQPISVNTSNPVSFSNGRLNVNITKQGGGWAQAGLVTKHGYDVNAFYPGSDKQGFEASIDVTSVGALKEMAFLISGEKTTNQNPAALNNWYRILKNASNSTIMVQNRLNGGTVSTKLSKPWTSSTGQLRIKISTGSIAFYEGGQILYAEPFALPSNNCYIYAYTNSDQNGTGTFDNFEIIPAQNFRADFQNGSLDGWTADAGSWAIQNGRLQSSTNGSFIHYNTQFHTNRHVRADIQTLSSDGVDPWDVAWLIAKAIDGNNRIYGLINTDGRVELSLWYNGQHTVYSASSSLSPYDQHSMAISIIGPNAKLWVDGQLYINQDNDHFDDIHEGYVGFYSNGSTAAYDNIAVLNGDGATEGCQSCYTCEISCQTCQTGCEVGCQTGCEVSCQTGCEVTCQTGCEVSCQTTCELSCQTGCQVTCQTGCEISCQTCNTCQTTCELTCQTCNTCQTTCELSCQTGCQVSCQTGCEVSCQTGCEVSCQTGCEVACQTTCEICQSCYDDCYEVCYQCESCQTACELSCQNCQTGCEVGCQNCQTGCEVCQDPCQTCQEECQFCQSCYEDCYEACYIVCYQGY